MADRIVNDEDVDKALCWLRDSAQDIGDARAEVIRAGHMVKVTKALVMKMHNDKPVSVQEREALASPQYLAAIERDAVAAGEFEKLKSLRDAAALKIEAWRSEQATWRAMKL